MNERLKEILESEGIPEEDQGLNECETVETDIGFFSFRMVYGLPYLVHFWIAPGMRTPSNFYRMAKKYKNLIRSKGFTQTIVNAPENGRIARFIESYTRTKPYSRQHGQTYYLYGVIDHGKKQDPSGTRIKPTGA
jgi:hypothetical protein